MSLENFDIRYSEESDVELLRAWLPDALSCEPFPFGFAERDEALKNWIGFAKYKASLTGMLGETPCAVGTLFLMPYKKVAHHCAFYLLVAPEHRRKGIGSSMVRNLAHLAKTRFRLESLHAELFEPSPLRSVLDKLGFQPFARQDNFVHLSDGPHARVLMELFWS